MFNLQRTAHERTSRLQVPATPQAQDAEQVTGARWSSQWRRSGQWRNRYRRLRRPWIGWLLHAEGHAAPAFAPGSDDATSAWTPWPRSPPPAAPAPSAYPPPPTPRPPGCRHAERQVRFRIAAGAVPAPSPERLSRPGPLPPGPYAGPGLAGPPASDVRRQHLPPVALPAADKSGHSTLSAEQQRHRHLLLRLRQVVQVLAESESVSGNAAEHHLTDSIALQRRQRR